MLKGYKLLIETYSLTAYFRSILNISYSFEIIDFLIKKSNLNICDLKSRWDNFNKLFGKKYGEKISALSFSTIIEARGKRLNQIVENQNNCKSITIELASGFTPRGLNQVSNGYRYIETDKPNVIELKNSLF